jgi:site-specific DNA recombinase
LQGGTKEEEKGGEMKKAAIYCRVSTEDQEKEGTSLQTQLEACLKYCQAKGYDVAYHFSETYSGLSIERPELDKLRELVRTKAIDVVVCHCLDRHSRNATQGVILRDELDKHHVLLESVTEDIGKTPLGEAITFLRGTFSQLEVEKIRERTMRGRRARAKEGKLPTGGLNLYGYVYNKETSKRRINPDEAQVIRQMVDYVLKYRLSLNEVCRRLMSGNILAPKGGQKWSRATVGRILSNEVYTGTTYCMKMKAVEPKNSTRVKRQHKNTARKLLPKEEWLPLPGDTTPQIITPDEFEDIRAQLARNRELSPRNQKHQYLLRSFLHCHECGRKYYGTPVHGKRYYRCSGRSSVLSFGQPCDSGMINADQIEAKIWDLVIGNITNPDEMIKANCNQSGEDLQLTQLKEELGRSQGKLRMLDAAETRLIRLYRFTEVSEVKVKTECERIKDERTIEEQKASSLRNTINNYKESTLTDEEVRTLAETLRMIMIDCLSAEETFDQRRLILDLFNLKVNIGKESFTVDIKIPSDPPKEYSNTVLQRC